VKIKKVSDFLVPIRDVTENTLPWQGIIKSFPARESLVSDIPTGEGKIAKLVLPCIICESHYVEKKVKVKAKQWLTFIMYLYIR
jgi:hypothetical protein